MTPTATFLYDRTFDGLLTVSYLGLHDGEAMNGPITHPNNPFA